MEKADIQEKLIVVGISVGIFLPIRLLFTYFVSDSWLGSLGIMSAIAVLMVFLIKKEKLGKLGKMFERQMRKTLVGKTGKYIIGFALFFLFYFGATLIFIDRGNTIYEEDKQIFFLSIIKENGYSVEDISTYQLLGPAIIENTDSESLQNIIKIDYIFSIAYAVMNDMSEGWLSHFVIIMFVEQIELIGLLIFFRTTFKPASEIRLDSVNN